MEKEFWLTENAGLKLSNIDYEGIQYIRLTIMTDSHVGFHMDLEEQSSEFLLKSILECIAERKRLSK